MGWVPSPLLFLSKGGVVVWIVLEVISYSILVKSGIPNVFGKRKELKGYENMPMSWGRRW
jgi:hypothetical protein